MVNPWAGEVAITLNGVPMVAKLTLGALAELEAGQLEPISWREGWADLQASVAAHGGLNVGETTEEIVAHMRRIREEIFEAEYAHLYR